MPPKHPLSLLPSSNEKILRWCIKQKGSQLPGHACGNGQTHWIEHGKVYTHAKKLTPCESHEISGVHLILPGAPCCLSTQTCLQLVHMASLLNAPKLLPLKPEVIKIYELKYNFLIFHSFNYL